MRARGWVLGGLFATAACANLDPLAAGVCNNGVVDSGEDCDFGHDTATCVSCRLVCSTAADCPPGWGCGHDQICRQATGHWHRTGPIVHESTINVGLADLDGDGQLDLFGYSTRVWTHLGGGSNGFGDGLTMDSDPNDFGVPAFGDLDGDGVIDVVAGAPQSLKIATAHHPFTGFAPVPQVSFGIQTGVAFPIRTADAPFQDILVLDEASNRITGVIRQIGKSPPTPTDLGAPPLNAFLALVADLDGDDRDELVLVIGDDLVVFETVDDAQGRPILQLRATVPLGGANPTAIFAGDVTGDGVVDLVVETATSNLSDPRVAAGDSTGGYGPITPAPELGVAGRLLGLADLDGDGKVDLIGVRGLTHVRAGVATLVAASTLTWQEVVVGDFNHDGLLDVAARRGENGLEILLAGPDGLYDHQLRLVDRSIAKLTAGDFDGDGFGDLAIVTIAGTGADFSQAGAISFGGPGGPTEALSFLDVTGLDLFKGFQAANFHFDASLVVADATTDLLVAAQSTDNPTTDDVLLFAGSEDRTPVAAFAVSSDPSAVLVGRFAAAGDHGDVIVLRDGGVDLVTGRGDGRLRAADLVPMPTSAVATTPNGTVNWCIFTSRLFLKGALVADLDGDHRDEIIGIPCGGLGDPVTKVQIAHVVTDGNGTPTLTATDVMIASPVPLRFLEQANLVDLDGDGSLDLILSFGVEGNPSGSALAVLWGEAGTLSGDAPTILAAQPSAEASVGSFGPFTIVNATGTSSRQLLVDVFEVGLAVVDVDGRTLKLDASVASQHELSGGGGGPVCAGDVDGDGVDDVVVRTFDGMFLFLGCTTHDTSPDCP